MNELTIYTLTLLVRGFSNEITVRGLASRLNISYSTLARCKNGKWPRSVTIDSMRSVFEECRERYFEGDGNTLATSVVTQLKSQGIDTAALEETLGRDGYDAFLSELLATAASTPVARTSAKVDPAAGASISGADAVALEPSAEVTPVAGETVAETAPVVGEAATAEQDAPTSGVLIDEEESIGETDDVAEPSTVTLSFRDLLFGIPVVIILLVGLFRFSLSDFLVWANGNRLAFVAISVLIAVLPTIAGLLVDAPLAWHAFHQCHPEVPLTYETFTRVAKFGDSEGYVKGTGRVDLTPHHLVHQVLCNILGMETYVALLLFLFSLPGFEPFLKTHDWTDFFKAGIAVACLVALAHMRDQSTRPQPLIGEAASIGDMDIDNPDTFQTSRFHVWANNAHLVWTISLIVVLLLCLISYSVVMLRTIPAPALMGWPYLSSMLFFAYAHVSPYALRIQSMSIASFVPGVLATSLGFFLVATVCYLPSPGALLVASSSVLCSIFAIVFARTYVKRTQETWFVQGSGRTYTIAVIVFIASLFVIGIITSSFGI